MLPWFCRSRFYWPWVSFAAIVVAANVAYSLVEGKLWLLLPATLAAVSVLVYSYFYRQCRRLSRQLEQQERR